jgi:hypothetical protein
MDALARLGHRPARQPVVVVGHHETARNGIGAAFEFYIF